MTTLNLPEELLKLTTKQRAYVDARALGHAPSESARVAGYSEAAVTSVWRQLERHPRVSLILKEMARQAIKKLTVTRTDVLEGLMDAVHAAATSTELTMAWREIGKLTGAYEPEVKRIEVTHRTEEQMQQLSDKELIEIAGAEGFTLDGEFEVVDDAVPELEVLGAEDFSDITDLVDAEATDGVRGG